MDLKELLNKKSMSYPFVIKNIKEIENWKLNKMKNFNDLAGLFNETSLKYRIGEKHHKGVQWDKDCEVIFATINEFIQWTTLEDVEDENKFKRFDANKMWAYADYMYLKPLLENMNINLKEIIDWSKLGFNKEEGVDSSIWIGSKGAYTVCHQDSYGYNLVYQVSGRKKWILFHPSDEMYPTRLPYEESSIFSKIDILNININKYPKFKDNKPYIITLEAGDMLYVPCRWWHFVENLENSCSVNARFPLEIDCSSRVVEAVTRLIVNLCTNTDVEDSLKRNFVNPNEEGILLSENLQFLQKSIDFNKMRKKENKKEEIEKRMELKKCGCRSGKIIDKFQKIQFDKLK